MKFPYDIVVFDLECNQPSNKIIEIGAVLVSRDFKYLDEFRAFVNPDEPISNDILQLCQLSTDNVTYIGSTERLKVVNDAFYAWATKRTKNVILASWGNFDVTELHIQDPTCRFRRKALDIKSIAQWELARWGIKSTNSLSASCGAFSIDIVHPQHRALPDAQTTANLFIEMGAKNARLKRALDFAAGALA